MVGGGTAHDSGGKEGEDVSGSGPHPAGLDEGRQQKQARDSQQRQFDRNLLAGGQTLEALPSQSELADKEGDKGRGTEDASFGKVVDGQVVGGVATDIEVDGVESRLIEDLLNAAEVTGADTGDGVGQEGHPGVFPQGEAGEDGVFGRG